MVNNWTLANKEIVFLEYREKGFAKVNLLSNNKETKTATLFFMHAYMCMPPEAAHVLVLWKPQLCYRMCNKLLHDKQAKGERGGKEEGEGADRYEK